MTCIRSNRLENRFSGLVQAFHRASVSSLQRTNTLLSRLAKEQRGHADTHLHRRHLNETQRAVIAARLANIERGGDGSNQYQSKSANLRNSISQPEAAKMLNVSERSIQNVKSVERDAPDLVPLMEAGRIVELYLRAWNTQQGIAEMFGIDRTVVTRVVQNGNSAETHKDFTPPLYNIWNLKKQDNATACPRPGLPCSVPPHAPRPRARQDPDLGALVNSG